MNDPFRPLRKAFRAWCTRRRLAQEARRYHNQATTLKLKIPSDAEIQGAIAVRFPTMSAKPKGALNILAIYHSYNWEEPSLGPALAAFGTVWHLDWKDQRLAKGIPHGASGWRTAMNAGLLAQVAAWHAETPFDVIFTYLSGEQVTAKTMAALRRFEVPTVNLALNDKEAFVGRVRAGRAAGARDICRYFDLCWTSTEDALEKYVVEGATPLYLPEGANPLVHHPYPEEKRYDISFVGQCYGNRPGVIAKLREAGIPIETFGPGWPNGPLSTEEMVRTWSRSRINLGFGGVSGLRDTFCLKGRDFEVPMSGGLYLTEHHEELLPFYEIGTEIMTYTDQDDLLQKITYLLNHPAAAENIRMAGYERAMREHTWEMRFERVFILLGVLR